MVNMRLFSKNLEHTGHVIVLAINLESQNKEKYGLKVALYIDSAGRNAQWLRQFINNLLSHSLGLMQQ